MLYIKGKPRNTRKGYKKNGNNNRQRVRVTKEAWETACLELHKDAYTIDHRRLLEISQMLGISEMTFMKYYNLWIANGRKTDDLAIIAKKEGANNDQSGNKAEVGRIQDLPKIQRSYKRTL